MRGVRPRARSGRWRRWSTSSAGTGLQRAVAPLQEEVKAQGLWAAHLDPELGGQGFGQVKLGLMHEILGTSPIAPLMFGNAAPDSGNSRDPRAGRNARAEGALPASAAGRRPEVGVQHDRARAPPARIRRCCRPRAVRDGDDWVINGHKWFSSNGSIADFLIVMAVTDPDARPHQRASMFIVDADTPGRQGGPRRRDDGASLGELRPLRQPRRDPLRGRPRPGRGAARRRGRRLPDRPAAALPGPDPPLHALARRRPARVRHALRALAVPLRARHRRWASTRRSRTGSPTPRPRCRRRG